MVTHTPWTLPLPSSNNGEAQLLYASRCSIGQPFYRIHTQPYGLAARVPHSIAFCAIEWGRQTACDKLLLQSSSITDVVLQSNYSFLRGVDGRAKSISKIFSPGGHVPRIFFLVMKIPVANRLYLIFLEN